MKKTILVIEDEKEIRSTLKEFLEFENYDVLTADNGQAALDILKVSTTPHLILLDMKMPIMNGWQFAGEYLKAYDHTSPIVVITAAADAEQRAKDIDAVGWISKPFNLDMLLQKIKQLEK
jgi:DNA-binding response OmpR family regulator